MLPLEKGPCMNYVERYYFDTLMGKCEKFTYGGKINQKINKQNKIIL